MNAVLQVQHALRQYIDHEPRVFKAGPGEYAEYDKFLGVTVPKTRLVSKLFRDLPLRDLEQLMTSEWHDERLCALFILVLQYPRASAAQQKAIYDFYITHTAHINNWDLVDASAEYIVGPYLENRPEKMLVLQKLAASTNLWERRIAMLATFDYIRTKHRADEALVIAERLLHDQHDLIQKAVGWMLREIGKRVDRKLLLQFLDKHAATMPRTTLRYAIEHFSPQQRTYYMGLKGVK
ncbi:MAG TPA: DNA alkylation repair protein [Candidatus Saccharimonadales bacterium]|nr:DNA alkylation repair protein [Candidatus Saccharimonadales bacterium]